MPEYIVTEVVDYRVEADSAEEAERIIAESENPDQYFSGVRSRTATHVATPPSDQPKT